MTEEQKAEFDETRAARTAIFTELEAKLKLKAGFDTDDCDSACKTLWLDEFNKWDKEVYT